MISYQCDECGNRKEARFVGRKDTYDPPCGWFAIWRNTDDEEDTGKNLSKHFCSVECLKERLNGYY